MPAGRPRKPTYLKLVTGTQRASRVNPAEPKPTLGRPRIPGHLTSHARVAWCTYAPLLEKMGVLSVNDALALERLCECYAEIRTHAAVLAADGMTWRAPLVSSSGVVQKDMDGKPMFGPVKVRPEVAALADADRRFKGWLTEFGLTPAARSKVKAMPEQDAPAPGSDLLD